MIEQAVSEAGLEVVEIALRGRPGSQVLRVDIDRAGAVGVGIDDCQTVSRALSERLDEADLVAGRYTLEVSSPGADRPIRTEDDFRRNTGRPIVVRTGNGTFRGRLLGNHDGFLALETKEDDAPVKIPLDDVLEARADLGF